MYKLVAIDKETFDGQLIAQCETAYDVRRNIDHHQSDNHLYIVIKYVLGEWLVIDWFDEHVTLSLNDTT